MIKGSKGRKNSRLKRATKTRKRISEFDGHRISVFRSVKHIYVQLLTSKGDKVVTTISTNQKALRKTAKTNNIECSKVVGKKMAEFIKKEKIDKVAFDRSGYKYHGKIKAVADSIRENGVKI
tara:strand:- start:833 stop:1198 length:366 start_codon:yes stop_codon:yes gene_type:complete